jgi:hypothetical protein
MYGRSNGPKPDEGIATTDKAPLVDLLQRLNNPKLA